jgi:hypothetical protein
MKPTFTFLCFFSLSIFSSAQSTNETTARKNLFIEVGGNGMAFNVIGETRFKPGASGWGIKAGAGGFTTSYESLFTAPVQLNYLATKNGRDFVEVGVGATFLHYDDKYDYSYPGYTYSAYPTEVINLTINQKNSVYGNLTLGYRRQPANGGILWGIALTPHFNSNGFWPVWGGVKFGYSFRSLKTN